MPDDYNIETLIIGMGSYYGHDVSGLELIKALEKNYSGYPHLKFYASNSPQEILLLTEKLKQHPVAQLIIFDALPETLSVCEITQYQLEDIQDSLSAISDHSSNLYEVLKMIRLLYFPQLKIIILGLPAKPLPEILQQSTAKLQALI